jgi:3-hydroxyisobutyrate dehydrogenase
MVAPGLRNRFEGVLTGSQETWWTTVLGVKNAGLALDIAQEANVELPAGQVVQRLYETAAAADLENADIAAVTKLYRGPATAGLTRHPNPAKYVAG